MATDISNGWVRTELHNGITSIEFSHPQGNSLPLRILEEMASAIHAAGIDSETRVIILRSTGDGAFCAGASLDEVAALQTKEEAKRFFDGFAQVINAMRLCPKFIIGRIHGKCVGGGVGLAAAVDYAIAVEPVEIRLSELHIGIGPFVIGPVVERKIGLSAFTQLAIDAGMWRKADWARSKGLFAEVHPTLEGMDESIVRLSNFLMHSSKDACTEMKKVFWSGTEHWDQLLEERASISARLVLTDASKAAVSSSRKR